MAIETHQDRVEPAGTGCNKADHQNSEHDKVNNYVEPSWFSGGSRPSLFPWIAVPQIGLRFKPIKQFVGRLGIGFSLTGFWFGLSADYGLESRPDTAANAARNDGSSGPAFRFH